MRRLILFFVGVCIAWIGNAQVISRDMQMKVDVAYLASDLLAGRAAGSPFADQAAEYIASRFAELSLKPMGDSASYLQRFPIKIAGHGATSDAPQLYTSNVLGLLDNGSKHTIVIGAHYDHLGFGGSGSGSLHVGDPEPHNGADDNASGVALLFDLAERFQQEEAAKKYNILFAAFSAEELGLIGSKYLVQHHPVPLTEVSAMINFDMVGRLNSEKVLAVNGTGTSPSWDPLLALIAKDRVKIKAHESGLGPSDHSSYYLENIPVLHFFTGQHPQYHKPEDDIILINWEGMVTISDMIYDLVQQLPDATGLAFAKTKDKSQQEVSSFKVTMGVMPDYVYDGFGMRIDGVLDDRPAQQAGLERGDVLIDIDGVEIKDIYVYMEQLGKHEKGDSVNIIIERKGEKLKKRITF